MLKWNYVWNKIPSENSVKVDRMPVASVPEENMLHTFEKKSKATTKIWLNLIEKCRFLNA